MLKSPAFSPDGKLIAFTDQHDGKIYLWGQTKGHVNSWQAHAHSNVVFSSGGDFLVSAGGVDKKVKLWIERKNIWTDGYVTCATSRRRFSASDWRRSASPAATSSRCAASWRGELRALWVCKTVRCGRGSARRCQTRRRGRRRASGTVGTSTWREGRSRVSVETLECSCERPIQRLC